MKHTSVMPLGGGPGGSSINPITTRAADYAHHITASPPGFEIPAASLNMMGQDDLYYTPHLLSYSVQRNESEDHHLGPTQRLLHCQRCRWDFECGWASNNVVGIICPPDCYRVNWTLKFWVGFSPPGPHPSSITDCTLLHYRLYTDCSIWFTAVPIT